MSENTIILCTVLAVVAVVAACLSIVAGGIAIPAKP